MTVRMPLVHFVTDLFHVLPFAIVLNNDLSIICIKMLAVTIVSVPCLCKARNYWPVSYHSQTTLRFKIAASHLHNSWPFTSQFISGRFVTWHTLESRLSLIKHQPLTNVYIKTLK
jgi:hypothetical protein